MDTTRSREARSKYYTFDGKRVAMRKGGTLTYLHGDHLGSTSLATHGTSGAKVSRVLYFPYGETRYTEGTLPTDFKYTGQRHEMGFGLYDYVARFYDPYLGRFISADTIVPEPANPQDWNRYTYVGNNPVLYRDPSGHRRDKGGDELPPEEPPWYAGALIAVAESVDRLNDPELSPTMERYRQTYKAAVDGWTTVVNAVRAAASYTTSAVSEGRWDDASRGARGLLQMGAEGTAASRRVNAQMVVGTATAPFRAAHDYGVAYREFFIEGTRSEWDFAFHFLDISGVIVSTGAMADQAWGASKTTTTSASQINPWPGPSSGRQTINGITYSEHALEQMMPVGLGPGRGMPPSVVQNAVLYGQEIGPGTSPNSVIIVYENVTVVWNPTDEVVVTVWKTGH